MKMYHALCFTINTCNSAQNWNRSQYCGRGRGPSRSLKMESAPKYVRGATIHQTITRPHEGCNHVWSDLVSRECVRYALREVAIARPHFRGPRLSLAALPEVTSPLVLHLFAYWDQIRAGRLAPSWPEIDPGAIKSCLPYLLVSEVFGEPFDVRYRLTGSEIVASYGYDPTGTTMRGSKHPPVDGAWPALYDRLIDRG